MYIDFEQLPDTARVWIYQADRILNQSEQAEIQNIAKQFTESWDSHGATVKGSFALKYDRFLILATDDDFNAPSGCSIDKSVALMRELGQKYDVDFFNRTNTIFRDGDDLKTAKMTEIKAKVSAGELTADTFVFDNTIQTKQEMQKWQRPAQETWLKRYF